MDGIICPSTTVSTSTEVKKKSYPMPATCIGKASCDLKDFALTIGDNPYTGIAKQVKADYVCKMP